MNSEAALQIFHLGSFGEIIAGVGQVDQTQSRRSFRCFMERIRNFTFATKVW